MSTEDKIAITAIWVIGISTVWTVLQLLHTFQ